MTRLLLASTVVLTLACNGTDPDSVDSGMMADANLPADAGTIADSGLPADADMSPALPPPPTTWAPEGARVTGDDTHSALPERNAFHTMHVDSHNSDNIWGVVSTHLELDWVAETSFYVPEGPTFDDSGNLYFSPLFPNEDVSLVSLDVETGDRNWAITGDGVNAGSGAILILNDPSDASGDTQIIYHATYTEAMALRPDGSEIWRVPTGLTLPEIVPGERSTTHSYGFNYHPQRDALVGLTMGGELFAFDRVSGTMIAPVGQIPGSPAASTGSGLPQAIIDSSNALTDEVFGQTPSGLSFFELIVDVIFGGGSLISNYFAIDRNTGRIFVAATANDADDGTTDGISDLGALYAVELVEDATTTYRFEVVGRAVFEGGTGATPTVSEDGQRVYVSDNLGHVIVLDRDLNEIWRLDVGAPLAASIAVSPDNAELYVVTRRDIMRLTDLGASGRLDWTANLDETFADDPSITIRFNALTPTITANGVAVSIGGGRLFGEREIMTRVGVGLLDRETGRLRGFTEGREESIAVTSVSPGGGIFTAHSPVRRVSGRVLFSSSTPAVIGGIARYKPVRHDFLAREAVCAASARASNAAAIASTAAAAAAVDVQQIRLLLTQASNALSSAVRDGDLAAAAQTEHDTAIQTILVNLDEDDLTTATSNLGTLCGAL